MMEKENIPACQYINHYKVMEEIKKSLKNSTSHMMKLLKYIKQTSTKQWYRLLCIKLSWDIYFAHILSIEAIPKD